MRLSPTLFSASAWETVIGLELHVQIRSPQKLFSATRTSWEDPPNTNVSLFDAGYPGTLPTLSRHPVKQGLLTALSLQCYVPPRSQFDRKHYFYHDQPLGYQITQHYHPLALAGHVILPTTPPKTVRIQQIQLEQDTAKTTHSGKDVWIDFNRAGTGLMEIITEADITSAEEATTFVRTLRGILRRIGSSDGDMEKGSLRVDCNISVNRHGEPRGTRTEIKNLNSLRFLSMAIASEIKRQRALIESGGVVVQETRGFDESIMDTRSLRSKEGAKDYRYMPDGNLSVVVVDPAYLETLASSLPELPIAAYERLQKQYHGVTAKDAMSLVALDPETFSGVEFFETAAAGGRDARSVVNWIADLVGALGKLGRDWEKRNLEPLELGEVVDLVKEGKLTGSSAKILLGHLFDAPPSSSSRVTSLLTEHSLLSLPIETIDALCSNAIAANPKIADQLRQGRKPQLVMALVGKVMKETQGRADAKAVAKKLKAKLGLSDP